MEILIVKNQLVFDNPPSYLFDPVKLTNQLPVLHTFSPSTGLYFRDGIPVHGSIVIQPLLYRIKHVARRGQRCASVGFPDHEGATRHSATNWLDVLFLNRFNRLGLLSLPNWYGIDLLQTLKLAELRGLKPHGVWLCINRRVNETTANRGKDRTYLPQVVSYYWATRSDCARAARTIADLHIYPWSAPTL